MAEREPIDRPLDSTPEPPALDSSEAKGRFGALEGLAEAKSPDEAPDQVDIHIDPDPEYLAWHAEHGGMEDPFRTDERYRVDGDRTPWPEHDENWRREHYTVFTSAEIGVQEAYAEHGFDRETIERINAVGGRMNCGECTRAVADTLDGRPHSAGDFASVDGRGEDTHALEQWAGAEFGDRRPPEATLLSVESYLRSRGDGAQVIVAGYPEDPRQTGHVFNMARINGHTVLIDAQGFPPDILSESGHLDYINETDLKSLQWLPVERTAA